MTFMIQHSVVQGTDAWSDLRARFFSASEAPMMMGKSKFTSREKLLNLYATGNEDEISSFMQSIFDDGHEKEEMARPVVERLTGLELFPVTGTRLVAPGMELLASFDGLTLMEDVCFEHKGWNKELAEMVRQNTLTPHYYWQLEQEILVSRADKVVFVASDGTEDKMEMLEYYPVPGRALELIKGWEQFREDLQSYVPPVAVVKAVADPIKAMPALMVQVDGAVSSSNLKEYQEKATEFIDNIKSDLKTDQDFADADAAVKMLKSIANNIDTVKDQALSQTVDIKTLFDAMGQLRAVTDQKRILLEKLIQAEKTNVKNGIIARGKEELRVYLRNINNQLCERHSVGEDFVSVIVDFALAIKGKRTVDTLNGAANDALAAAKIEAKDIADDISKKMTFFASEAAEYSFLFQDLKHFILTQSYDHFELVVKSRISDHKKEEDVKEEQRQQKIRDEIAEEQRQEKKTIINAAHDEALEIDWAMTVDNTNNAPRTEIDEPEVTQEQPLIADDDSAESFVDNRTEISMKSMDAGSTGTGVSTTITHYPNTSHDRITRRAAAKEAIRSIGKPMSKDKAEKILHAIECGEIPWVSAHYIKEAD